MQTISPTVVLRFLKRKLGSMMQSLELNDNQIMDTFYQQTLPEFSKYFPYYVRVTMDQRNQIDTGSFAQIYKIPNKDNLHILNVHNVWNTNTSSYVSNPGVLTFYTNPFTQQLLNDQLSATVTPTTWEFVEPDMLNIKPIYINTGSLVEVKVVHPRHLRTVPIGLKEALLQLAYFDILESLWPLRQRISTLASPLGNLEMFMTAVESATSDRQQLLDRFNEQFLRSAKAKKIWFA